MTKNNFFGVLKFNVVSGVAEKGVPPKKFINFKNFNVDS